MQTASPSIFKRHSTQLLPKYSTDPPRVKPFLVPKIQNLYVYTTHTLSPIFSLHFWIFVDMVPAVAVPRAAMSRGFWKLPVWPMRSVMIPSFVVGGPRPSAFFARSSRRSTYNGSCGQACDCGWWLTGISWNLMESHGISWIHSPCQWAKLNELCFIIWFPPESFHNLCQLFLLNHSTPYRTPDA